MKFESVNEPLASRATFRRRYARYILLAFVLFVASAGLGTIGFRVFARLDWLDAFVQAIMMLTTMGPIYPVVETDAKLFAALFAMYSSLVFLATAGILVAPLLHRVLHRFHLEMPDSG